MDEETVVVAVKKVFLEEELGEIEARSTPVTQRVRAHPFRCFPNSLGHGGEIVAGWRAHWQFEENNKLLAVYLEAHAWNAAPDGRWVDTTPSLDSQNLLFVDAARRVEKSLRRLLAKYLKLLNPDLRIPKRAGIREWAEGCDCRVSPSGGFTVAPAPGRQLSPQEYAEVEKLTKRPCLRPDILICFAPREKVRALWPATSLAREVYDSSLS